MVLGMFAFTWAGVLFGMLVRSPDAMQGIGFIVIFPLSFMAGTFVPIAGMDACRARSRSGIRSRRSSPSVRGLTQGTHSSGSWQLAHPELAMALWCVVILAICRAARAAPLQPHARGLSIAGHDATDEFSRRWPS